MFIVGAEHQPRYRGRPQQVVEIGLLAAGEARARLGAEILDDDFLQMAVSVVQLPQRQQGLDAFEREFRRCRSGCPR